MNFLIRLGDSIEQDVQPYIALVGARDEPDEPSTIQHTYRNTGHWKATGRILGNFWWKILYKNLDLKGGVQGEGTLPGPCTTPL